MRAIKFRAWDKERKRMCEVTNIMPNDDGSAALQTLFANGLVAEIRGENYPRVFELMQYTGLKDKNGKEIYEGDIVSLIETPPDVMNILTGGNDYIGLYFMGVVEWDNEGADYNVVGKKDLRGLGNGKQTLEVIGNMYENPELLK